MPQMSCGNNGVIEMANNLQVEVKKGKDGKVYAQIALCLDADSGPSKTGKSTMVATSNGFAFLGADSNNKPVRFSLNVIK